MPPIPNSSALGGSVVDLFPIRPNAARIRRRALRRRSRAFQQGLYSHEFYLSDPQLQWERRSWWRRLFSLRRY